MESRSDLTSGQVHNYGTRTANNYGSHPCRVQFATTVSKFGILSQHQLPAHLVLLALKNKKLLEFKKRKQFWFGQAVHTQYLFVDLSSFEVASLTGPVVSRGLLAKSMLRQTILILKYGK